MPANTYLPREHLSRERPLRPREHLTARATPARATPAKTLSLRSRKKASSDHPTSTLYTSAAERESANENARRQAILSRENLPRERPVLYARASTRLPASTRYCPRCRALFTHR